MTGSRSCGIKAVAKLRPLPDCLSRNMASKNGRLKTVSENETYSKVEMTKCKICGKEHMLDSYRTMRFYICPYTNRVYLVNDKEENNG